MSIQDQPPAPDLSPYLTVAGASDAIAFYERAFGAKVVSKQPTPDGAKLIHAALLFGKSLVMLSDTFPDKSGGQSRDPLSLGGTSVTLHLNVPDADKVFDAATKAGAKVIMPLADMFWGDRYGVVEDPFGHRWSIGTPKRAVSQAELDAAAKHHFA